MNGCSLVHQFKFMQDFDIIPSRAKRYYLPIANREVAQLAIYYAYYNIHKWMIAVILL